MSVLIPLFGVDYVGGRVALESYPSLDAAAAWAATIEWSEAYCCVAVVDGVEFVYDEDGRWTMI